VFQIAASESSVLGISSCWSVQRCRLIVGFHRMGFWYEAIFVDLTCQEIEEILFLFLNSLPFGVVFSDCLLILTFGHFKENIEKWKSGEHENKEEVKNFESKISLLLEIVPSIQWIKFICWHSLWDFRSKFSLLLLKGLNKLLWFFYFIFYFLIQFCLIQGRWIEILVSNWRLLTILGMFCGCCMSGCRI
jgi:hypothetical protein